MVVKTLDIGQQRRVTLERWDTDEVSPAIAPGNCLEGLQTMEFGSLPELRRWSWVARAAILQGRDLEEKASERESSRNLHRVLLKSSVKC